MKYNKQRHVLLLSKEILLYRIKVIMYKISLFIIS